MYFKINNAKRFTIASFTFLFTFFYANLSVAESINKVNNEPEVMVVTADEDYNQQIVTLAKFITAKFKQLSGLKKESIMYQNLHNELYGQFGLVENYMEMTDYDIGKMNRLYASVGGLRSAN